MMVSSAATPSPAAAAMASSKHRRSTRRQSQQRQQRRNPHQHPQLCHQPARGRVVACCVGVCCVGVCVRETGRRTAMTALGATTAPKSTTTTTTTGRGSGGTASSRGGSSGSGVGGGRGAGGWGSTWRGSPRGGGTTTASSGAGGAVGLAGSSKTIGSRYATMKYTKIFSGFVSSASSSSLVSSSSSSSRRGATVAPRAAAAGAAVAALNDLLGDGLTRDAGAAVAAAVGAYLWVKMFDVLASKDMLERKLSRKLIHTSCGPFFMLIWPLFSSAPEARFFAAAVPLLQGIRLAAIGAGVVKNEAAVRAVSREGDRAELLRGPLFYTGVMVVTTAVFWRTSPSGLAALSLMCGGDGLADIVGRRLGAGNKLWFNKNKSVAGSAAMFLGGFGLSMGLTALFHSLGYLDLSAAEAAPRLAVVAAACTAVEALPITAIVDDNISVPVLALVLGNLLFP